MKYKYMSNFSGEIVTGFKHAVMTTFNYMSQFPFEWSMLSWRYNKNGW